MAVLRGGSLWCHELVAVFVAYRYRLQKDPEVDPYLLLGGGARVT